MTERDGVLVGFAEGVAAREALARRLADAVAERGAQATVLTGEAVPAELLAGLGGTAGAGLAVEVTGGPRSAEPVLVPPEEPDPVERALRELERHGLPAAPAAPYSPDEEDEVARRLEALGYID
jgi:hypothetical protein